MRGWRESPVGVGEQHGVGDHHLILDDAGDVPRVEAMHPKNRDAALKPTNHVFVVVSPPPEASVAGHHAGHGLARGALGDEQAAEDRLCGRLVEGAENMVNLEGIRGPVGDLANRCL